ncbi:HlyD family efflux transporter periplasmic adaptor subunit [Heliobacterium gestii]|uniref:HlyD family efflux transporter periplasmic adaptor subunit n=1 Tax=Heliomicrobium gestii TaxID=2699 RepID=A0A845LGK5_HELGE|nr:HlyD family efflux transporter periplasmic adaptor subunit [Heliomicrobium gestii]MBM7867455.1 HlyD family secretion protein [Heliomicrobium gestii]MZP43719.1 HlyD family efflux transporter periplasmic adaptor subunit [Heliomicrobium gestii]
MSKPRQKAIAAALAVIVLTGAGYGYYARESAARENAQAVQYSAVERGDVTETVSASGTIQTPQQIKLSFTSGGGRLTSVSVKVGDRVEAGQVVATLDDANARAQMASAEANVSSAQAKLQQTRHGATAEAIAVQQANVDKAKAAWDGAIQAYENQQVLYNDRSAAQQAVVNAQNQVDTTAIQLRNAQAGLDSAKAKLTAAQAGPTDATLNAARIAVDVAERQQSIAEEQLDNARNQLNDAYGMPGPVGPDGLPTTNTAAIHQAESAYNQAQSSYNQSKVSLANAQKQLADLQAGPDKNVLAQMEAAVNQAQATADQAQASHNAAKQALTYGQQNYENRNQAKAQLDQVKNSLDQAEAAYHATVAQMNQTLAPPDSAAITAAQATVAQAVASLRQQQVALNNLKLTAPIDAIVAQVNGNVGELPAAASPLVVLNDANGDNLQVMAQISQSDVGKIQGGQAATFTVSTYPEKTFTGNVLMVYPEATTTNGVTSYNVQLTVDNREGLLKPGMTTSATITTGTRQNVIFVPAQALKEQNGVTGVYVAPDSVAGAQGTKSEGTAQPEQAAQTAPSGNAAGATNARTAKSAAPVFRPVVTGLFSTDRVEIVSGLSEGERYTLSIASTEKKASTSPFNFGAPKAGAGAVKTGGGK